jgi:hypothetical protein
MHLCPSQQTVARVECPNRFYDCGGSDVSNAAPSVGRSGVVLGIPHWRRATGKGRTRRYSARY